GTRFAFPNGTRYRINGHAQDVAMAHRVNLRTESWPSNERIVWRNSSIVAESQHFAGKIVRILSTRGVRRIGSADAHVDHAVFTEHHARLIVVLNRRKHVGDIN